MNHGIRMRSRSVGFSLVEVLVALVILLIGLLGLAGLMARSQQAEMESYQYHQALVLLQDMVGRLNANRKSASCYAVTTDTTNGTPFLGTSTTIGTPTCTVGTANEQTRAVADMTNWTSLLQGASETSGGVNLGAMIGARGCISYDATNNVYLVTVAWQGLNKTTAPASLTCGKNQYGDEKLRRAISMTVKIATLS